MGGMYQAPTRIDRRIGQEPFDRPRARPGQTVRDLLGLFGHMDMDRPIARQRRHGRQFVRADGAQAVRRHPDHGVGHIGGQGAASRDQIGEPVQIVDEAPLPVRRRLSPEPGMGVEDRQQGQGDARRLRRPDDPRRDLGPIGIGRARRGVVQIMELGDAGEAALQHFHEDQGGDGLDLFRTAPIQETVHQLAPSPEVVVRSPPRLGQARHGALKGVAVDICDARQGDTAPFVSRAARNVCFQTDNPSASHDDPHVVRPSIRQKGRLEPEGAIHRLRLKGHWTGPCRCDQYV